MKYLNFVFKKPDQHPVTGADPLPFTLKVYKDDVLMEEWAITGEDGSDLAEIAVSTDHLTSVDASGTHTLKFKIANGYGNLPELAPSVVAILDRIVADGVIHNAENDILSADVIIHTPVTDKIRSLIDSGEFYSEFISTQDLNLGDGPTEYSSADVWSSGGVASVDSVIVFTYESPILDWYEARYNVSILS